jgi:uncharacterized protein
MKNALILHGTSGSSKGNWLPWLQGELEERGWNVWVPDLPQATEPNRKRYNEFLLSAGWEFNTQSIIVGHSSGSVSILGLLQELPEGTRIDTAIFVGAFRDDLGREDLKGLFETPFDFATIRSRARRFLFLHSDNDPFCPLPGAQWLCEQVGGEMTLVPGAFHFSVGTGGELYKELPILLSLIDKP